LARTDTWLRDGPQLVLFELGRCAPEELVFATVRRTPPKPIAVQRGILCSP
jgi:hypothetical protein